MTAVVVNELQSLYEDHYPTVLRYIRSRVRNRALAEDLAAETFCQAASALDRAPELELSAGWLITVAKRRLLDHWRSEYRRRRVSCEDRPAVREFAPWEDDDVWQVLLSLPERQRVALCVRYLFDQPVQEVARQCGCSYTSAESLLARGRRRFADDFASRS